MNDLMLWHSLTLAIGTTDTTILSTIRDYLGYTDQRDCSISRIHHTMSTVVLESRGI
jgi:hypothetical protein